MRRKLFSVVSIDNEIRIAVHEEGSGNGECGLWAPMAKPFNDVEDLRDRLRVVGLPEETATSGISSRRSYQVTNEQLRQLGFPL
jgi:hypothetical protein